MLFIYYAIWKYNTAKLLLPWQEDAGSQMDSVHLNIRCYINNTADDLSSAIKQKQDDSLPTRQTLNKQILQTCSSTNNCCLFHVLDI